MGTGKRYNKEYKEMIVDLYKSGMSLAELSSEHGISKSTIGIWIKNLKEIKIDENEVMTMKEVIALKKEIAKIKEENEILKKAMAIFATGLNPLIWTITNNIFKFLPFKLLLQYLLILLLNEYCKIRLVA